MGNRVHFKSGTRESYELLYDTPEGPNEYSLYFVNTNGVFDPHGLVDEGDLYLGGALIGVSRSEKEQTDSSIYEIEQLLSQIQTIDSSSWYVGNDSSFMDGWRKIEYGTKKDYIYDVSLGDLIFSNKLDISVSLTLENYTNHGGCNALIFVEIGYYTYTGRDEWNVILNARGNPFSTQVPMGYIPSKTEYHWSTNAHLSGIIYGGPFYSSEHVNMLRLHVIVPLGNDIIVRETTLDDNMINASQIIIRGYKSLI